MIHKAFLKILLAVVLLLAIVQETKAVDCSEQAVSNRLSECVTFSVVNMAAFGQIAESLCAKVECSIKCFEDATRSCLSVGVYQVVDFNVTRVVRRYACEDAQGLVDAWANCGSNFMATACFSNLLTALTAAINLTKQASPDYTTYKTDYCSALNTYKSCVASTPFASQGSCTTVQAAKITTLYDIGLSIKACGINQDNARFTTLSGDPDCDTSDGIDIKPTLFLLSAAGLLHTMTVAF